MSVLSVRAGRFGRTGGSTAGILIFLAILLVGAGGAWWWMRPTPQKSAAAFMEALKKSDSQAINAMLSADTKKLIPASLIKTQFAMISGNPQLSSAIQNLTYKIQGAAISGDRATVKIQMTVSGNSNSNDFEFLREGGGWKLDFVSPIRKMLPPGMTMEQVKQMLDAQARMPGGAR